MAKLTLNMEESTGPSLELTGLTVAKEFIYEYDKAKDPTTEKRRHIKIDGTYYSIVVSLKDSEHRIKLFQEKNKSRIGMVSRSTREGRYEELIKGFDLLESYFQA